MTISPNIAPAIPAPCGGACGSHMHRREFLAATTIAAVLATLEACGNMTGPGGFSGASGGPLTITIANFGALATVSGIARVDGGNGAPTALVRSGASSFLALSMVCTHQGTTINVTGSSFTCPNHGARFAANGSWTGGQPTSGLQSYGTTFDATAGTVLIARPS